MNYIGKSLILIGIVLIIIGIFFTLSAKGGSASGGGGILSWLGRLPGDILIQKKNFSFYFPVTTCIIISIVLSAVFFLFFKR